MCYISTKEEPANIGSRESVIANDSLIWWEDSSWFPNKNKCPDQPFLISTAQSDKETNCIKELVTTTIQSNEMPEYYYQARVT